MWNSVQVSLGSAVHRGRYRMEGDQVAERCGLLKPEYLATARLKQLVSNQPLAA